MAHAPRKQAHRQPDPLEPDLAKAGPALCRSVFADPRKRKAHANLLACMQAWPAWRQRPRRLERLEACGKSVAVLTVQQGKTVALSRRLCRDRLCPFCSAVKAEIVRDNLLPVVRQRHAQGGLFSLLTLTMAHGPKDPLSHTFAVLNEALRRFLRSSLFKRHVRGWALGIEVTHSAANGFHPHVHLLIEAGFWPLASLQKLWGRCLAKSGWRTGGRQGVHVMALQGDLRLGLREALGYSCKAADLARLGPGELLELASVLRSRRLTRCCRAWSKAARRVAEQREQEASARDLAEGRLRVTALGLSRMAAHARYSREPEARELRKSLPPVLESLLELMALEPDLADEARRYRALYGWLLSDDDRGRGP